MREQILKSLQNFYHTHKRLPSYLVLSSDLARRFELENSGIEVPCMAYGLIVVENKDAQNALAELVEV